MSEVEIFIKSKYGTGKSDLWKKPNEIGNKASSITYTAYEMSKLKNLTIYGWYITMWCRLTVWFINYTYKFIDENGNE